EECDHDHSHQVTDAGIRKELLKLGATGIVLGYILYRKIKSPPRLVPNSVMDANSPVSLASFITILSGYPIFRDGFNAVQKEKKATDDTVIGIAVLASVVMGESLTGLSVVWLIQLGRILEMITLKRSRTAVRELMDITPADAWLLTLSDGIGDYPLTQKVPV